MQVGNIQQSQTNFNGAIYRGFIVNKSRDSALKAIHNEVSKMLKNKPYDLYINEDLSSNALAFSLKKTNPKNKFFSVDLEVKSILEDSNKLPADDFAIDELVINKLASTYKRTVTDLMGSYEEVQNFIDGILLPPRKIKNWLNKLGQKFGKNAPDNKEV